MNGWGGYRHGRRGGGPRRPGTGSAGTAEKVDRSAVVAVRLGPLSPEALKFVHAHAPQYRVIVEITGPGVELHGRLDQCLTVRDKILLPGGESCSTTAGRPDAHDVGPAHPKAKRS